MQYIVIGGCSFTINTKDAWGDWVHSRSPNDTVFNVASPGAGQGYISRSVIWKVQELLNSNVKPENIEVIVMWSGMDRHEVLSTNKETTLHSIYQGGVDYATWLENFIFINGHRIPYEESCWLKSSNKNEPWKNRAIRQLFAKYFEWFYTEEESFLKGLEHILRLQWFLKCNNIDYKFMSWMNIFNKYEVEVPLNEIGERFPGTGEKKYGHELFCMGWFDNNPWSPDRHFPKKLFDKISKDTPLLKDIYPNTTHLWDMMDWNKWWFYEDEQIEHGGYAEWISISEQHAWGNGYRDPGHPSSYSHEQFYKKVIEPIIEEFNEI